MSTVEQIARDIRKSPSHATEAVAEHLYDLGYSKTGHRLQQSILMDLWGHEGEFTPDHVAEYLHGLGYSKGPRMTEDEVFEAFEKGYERWKSDDASYYLLRRYWAEALGIKVVPGTRVNGGV